jgi:hypothetical protein
MLSRAAAAALASTVALAGAAAQDAMAPMDPMGGEMMAMDGKLVRITVENLTTGQGFSPSFVVTHGADAAALFALGDAASQPLVSVAEGGNIGGFSGDAAGMIGGAYGDAIVAIHTPPGATRSAYITVDEAHPLISGVWMLGMTNDGFSGISAVDGYSLTEAMTLDVNAYDAGSEINNERSGFLGALGEGNMRDPENGVVAHHTGIRGDADAPAEWMFDPDAPVARVTITPVTAGGSM